MDRRTFVGEMINGLAAVVAPFVAPQVKDLSAEKLNIKRHNLILTADRRPDGSYILEQAKEFIWSLGLSCKFSKIDDDTPELLSKTRMVNIYSNINWVGSDEEFKLRKAFLESMSVLIIAGPNGMVFTVGSGTDDNSMINTCFSQLLKCYWAEVEINDLEIKQEKDEFYVKVQ